MLTPPTLAALACGLLVGLLPALLLLLRRSKSDTERQILGERLATREARVLELESALDASQNRLREESERLRLESNAKAAAERDARRLPPLETELSQLRTENGQIQTLNAELQVALDNERESALEKVKLLTEAKEALSLQFKALADEILQSKSAQFSQQNEAVAEQNKLNLSQLLNPLKEQLGEFKKKVEDVYVQEGKDRSALAAEVKQLRELNQTLSEEAKNLTSALNGSNKTQGNYGELVLERVLEASGLRKGFEYHVQVSHQVDGRRQQPDVVIHLPEERRLVVDSKISLDAYQASIAAEDQSVRDACIKEHIASVQSHIKGLAAKNYQQLYGIQSLDFVILFMPLEPAFLLAVSHEKDLFMDAWNRNVLLVSPSTLLFVVRTVAHLWRQEAQTRNAQDIAHRGAELYDKLVGFVKDFEGLGSRLRQAHEHYDDALSKLHTGKGNVIRQAEMLRALGVKPSRTLPAPLVELALDTPTPELSAESEPPSL
jgi:DNA recombination protein RmuC